VESFEEKLRELKPKCDEAWYARKKDKEDSYTKKLRADWAALVDTYHEVLEVFTKTLPPDLLDTRCFPLAGPLQFFVFCGGPFVVV